jgi:hypothetical protein
MVQPAGDVHGPGRRAAPDGLGRGQGGAADPRARLVHAVEDRIVRGVEAPAAKERVVRGHPHGFEVVGPVHAGQRGVVGRGGHEQAYPRPVEHAELAGEGHGELHPDRVHRVVTHVIGEQRLVPDHRRRLRHGAHGATWDAAASMASNWDPALLDRVLALMSLSIRSVRLGFLGADTSFRPSRSSEIRH